MSHPAKSDRQVNEASTTANAQSLPPKTGAELAEAVNPYRLYAVLKPEMPGTKNSGVSTAAKALQLFCAEPGCSYRRLGSRLHLSESGVTKMIRALRNRGLIQRTRRQQNDLTPKGMALLQAAVE